MRISLPSGLIILIPPRLPWEKGKNDLTIRCGCAFHPRHVTSKLCLNLLDDHLASRCCKTLLDVGCGSGILALAAVKLGVSRVVGVDIDPRAVIQSRENAVANGLVDRTNWVLGTSSALTGRFDCVVANLPIQILLHHLDELTAAVQPGGSLLLSGFHDLEENTVRHRIAKQGFAIERSIKADLSLPELPPSGSYTWVAMFCARKDCL